MLCIEHYMMTMTCRVVLGKPHSVCRSITDLLWVNNTILPKQHRPKLYVSKELFHYTLFVLLKDYAFIYTNCFSSMHYLLEFLKINHFIFFLASKWRAIVIEVPDDLYPRTFYTPAFWLLNKGFLFIPFVNVILQLTSIS